MKYFNETEVFYFYHKGEKYSYSLTETYFGEWQIECDREDFRVIFGKNIIQKQDSLSKVLSLIGDTFPDLKHQIEIPFMQIATEAILNYGKFRKANFLRN